MIRATLSDTLGWLGWHWGQQVEGISSRHRRWDLSGPVKAVDDPSHEVLRIRADLEEFPDKDAIAASLSLGDIPAANGTLRLTNDTPIGDAVSVASSDVFRATAAQCVIESSEPDGISFIHAGGQLAIGTALFQDDSSPSREWDGSTLRETDTPHSTAVAAGTTNTVASVDLGSADTEAIAIATLSARETGLGADTDCAGYTLYAAVKVRSGAAVLIGQNAGLVAENTAGWAASFDVTGTTVQLRGTADAAHTTTFTCRLRIVEAT